MSDRSPLEVALEDDLRQQAVEFVARCDSDRPWRVSHTPGLVGPGEEVYDVDPANDRGPVVLVRRSDQQRFEVEVDVTVRPELKGQMGLTPEGGWD